MTQPPAPVPLDRRGEPGFPPHPIRKGRIAVLTYRITVPGPPPEVMRREVRLTVNGDHRPLFEVEAGDVVWFRRGEVVTAVVIDTDLDGFRGTPGPAFTFKVGEPLPAAVPGAPSLEAVAPA